MPKAAQHHALARQWQVLRLLPTKPPGITSKALVDKLDREGFAVTKRTVERDLAELSTLFGITCNDKGMPYGWHWMKGEYADLPGLSVSDAVSLRLVEDLLRPLLPSAMLASLEARFAQAKAKLAELSAENHAARWVDKVQYVTPSLPALPPLLDSEVVASVQEALMDEQQIEALYLRASSEPIQVTLHPLALIQRGQITYLAATAFDYTDIRFYALHRIQKVLKLPLQAIIPAGFSAESYSASGAMEFGDGEPVELEALVSVELASLLNESPLNATQQLLNSDAGFRLKVTIKDSWQLQWWILSQGAQINVIAPGALRSRVKNILRESLERYQEMDLKNVE